MYVLIAPHKIQSLGLESVIVDQFVTYSFFSFCLKFDLKDNMRTTKGMLLSSFLLLFPFLFFFTASFCLLKLSSEIQKAIMWLI